MRENIPVALSFCSLCPVRIISMIALKLETLVYKILLVVLL